MSTVIAWLVGLALIVLAAALLQYEPPAIVRLPWLQTALPETCGMQRNFGIDCPGCGLTRSFILAAHGRWQEALIMHPAGTLAFAFLLLLIPLRIYQGIRIQIGKPPTSTIIPELFVFGGLTVTSIVWWASKGIYHYFF